MLKTVHVFCVLKCYGREFISFEMDTLLDVDSF